MDINNLQHIRWACRRGMLELDLILLPFFDKKYMDLNAEEKQLFIVLLEEADPDLLNWLMGHIKPKAQFISLIDKIRQHAKTSN